MRRYQAVLLAVVLAALGIVITASGQARNPGKAAPAAASSTPPLRTIAEVLDLQVTQMEKQVISLAEAMPEDKFDFNPTQLNLADSRSPVRTFAGQLKHLATDNYDIWSPLTGDPIPAGIKDVNGPAELTSRADIMKFVKDSFALGHRAAATLNNQNLLEKLRFRGNDLPRAYLATYALIHDNDHCGQLAIYLRLAGVTPPGSRK